MHAHLFYIHIYTHIFMYIKLTANKAETRAIGTEDWLRNANAHYGSRPKTPGGGAFGASPD